jgi:ankyrin repeat protein
MVAARHRGNSRRFGTPRQGATPNTEKGVEVRNEGTALFFAATTGDIPTIRMLLDAGARPQDQMKLLGIFHSSPLGYAVTNNDTATTKLLLERGGDVNEIDVDSGVALLGWAAIGNRVGPLDALIAHGAKVNYVDKLGMTPLLYAASIDWGDTVVIQKLIAAGADPQIKTPEGRAALDLAQMYRHGRMTSVLSGKVASK